MSFQLPPSPLFHMIIFKDENEPLLESEAGDVDLDATWARHTTWGEWGPCSTSGALGVKTRLRKVDKKKETVPCNSVTFLFFSLLIVHNHFRMDHYLELDLELDQGMSVQDMGLDTEPCLSLKLRHQHVSGWPGRSGVPAAWRPAWRSDSGSVEGLNQDTHVSGRTQKVFHATRYHSQIYFACTQWFINVFKFPPSIY